MVFSLFVATLALSSFSAHAGKDAPKGSEVKFQGQLVWGTNDDPTKYPHFKEVDVKNQKILKNFKWKHYLVTNKKNFALSPGEQKRVQMSDKCEIVAKHRGASPTPGKRDPQMIAVTLMGEGKPVARHSKAVCEGHTIALGGDLKNGTAWFVLLKRVPAKPASE